MPIDAQGIRADVVIDPNSPVARMNFGGLYEPAINRISEFVRRRCADLVPRDPEAAVATLLSWYDDINPNYGQQVRKSCGDLDGLIAHVKESVADKIYLHIPPGLVTLTPENILHWAERWTADGSPVTYALHDRHGVKHTYTTKYPVLIGSKYMYCLAKLPYPTSAGVAHVSHYGIPIKPGGNVKHRFPTRMTAIRFGEDEFRVMLLDVAEREVVRLSNLLSNSPRGMEVMVEALLTSEYPTQIKRMPISDEELASSSAITAMFHHTMSVLGMETRNTLTTMEPPPGLRNDAVIFDGNEAALGSDFLDVARHGHQDDTGWLDTAMSDADGIADELLGDTSVIDEELGLPDTSEETGAEPLYDMALDASNEALTVEPEESPGEDGLDPLHDPNAPT